MKFYIFGFIRIVDKSLVYAVPELAIALGVAPATAYRAVIPGECLNLRLLRVFSVHPCQDPADNLERYPAVTCSQAIVDPAELRKHQFDRARVARDGFVDQLFDQRLALGDSPSLAVLTDDDRLLEHLLHHCREILRTPRAPLGISGLSFAQSACAAAACQTRPRIRVCPHLPFCTSASASSSPKLRPLVPWRAPSPV